MSEGKREFKKQDSMIFRSTLPERCAGFLKQLRNKNCRTFMVGVDGSQESDLALDVACSLLQRNDHVEVFHSYSIEDEEAAPHLRPDALKESYEIKLMTHSHLAKQNYSLTWFDREEMNVKHALMHFTNARDENERPQYLVLGYSGFKGIRKEGQLPTTAGSNSDFAMRNIHIPVVIVKTPVPTTGGKIFLMAVDETTFSEVGVEVLFTLVNARDRVILVHAYAVPATDEAQQDMSYKNEKVRQFYQNEIDRYCPTTNAELVLLPQKANSIACTQETLLDCIDKYEPDFFVMSPRAKVNDSISSLTVQMILSARCNIILCKAC